MDWKTLLAYITGSVDQELLLRNECLVTENRILRQQLKGRVRLSDGERQTLAEIGKRLSKQALASVIVSGDNHESSRICTGIGTISDVASAFNRTRGQQRLCGLDETCLCKSSRLLGEEPLARGACTTGQWHQLAMGSPDRRWELLSFAHVGKVLHESDRGS